MAGANASVKLGVTGISKFKSDIREAKDSIKTLDAQLALTEKQFKATGDQEEYLKQKTEQLQAKLEAQKAVAEGAQKALETMTDQGVDKSSKAFQDMIRTLANAKGNMLDTESQLKNIGENAGDAGNKTGDLNTKLQDIGKNVGWDNVAEGIEKITDKLERGARAAINFGKKIIQSAKGSTGLADDIKTMVDQFSDMGLTADSYQRMSKVAEFVDTPVEAILNARQRMNKALASDSGKKTLEETLGIGLNGQNTEDLFWEIGDALMNMGASFDKEAAAQSMFGRSWRELAPLFKTGREEYEKMLEEQNVLTDEQVEKLGKADDAIKSVEQEIELLKAQFWADNADTITSVLEWLVDNKDGVVTAIEAIGIAFAGLKIAEFAAEIGKVVSGFQLLQGASTMGAAGGGFGLTLGSATIAIAGAATIISGFAAAADRRINHPDQVRGTDQFLAAQSSGTEGLLAAYINAEKEKAGFDWSSATEAEAAAIQAQVEATRQRLMEAEGGAEALQAYSDWRQEHSYGNDYWELPDTLAQAVQELTGGAEAQKQSNSEMTQAANGLKGLPADIVNGIQSLMGTIGISIDGQVLLGYVNSGLAGMVTNP